MRYGVDYYLSVHLLSFLISHIDTDTHIHLDIFGEITADIHGGVKENKTFYFYSTACSRFVMRCTNRQETRIASHERSLWEVIRGEKVDFFGCRLCRQQRHRLFSAVRTIMLFFKAHTVERNWYSLVFGKLTNAQTVMHNSRHRLTASLTKWLRPRACQPMTNWLALLTYWSVRQKLNPVCSVQFSYVALYASSLWCTTLY